MHLLLETNVIFKLLANPTENDTFYLSSLTHSYKFTSNVLVVVYSKVIFNCGLTGIEPCFLVEHPSHNSMLSHRGPKFDSPRQCLNIFVIKCSAKLWWGWKFLIAIFDWLSPLSCVSGSWEKCRQVQKIILSTKGNCVLSCFVDLTYVDGSQPPARPECLQHSPSKLISRNGILLYYRLSSWAKKRLRE